MNKRWIVAEPITEDTAREFPEVHPLALQLLWNRGIKTQKDIEQFLTPDFTVDGHDPFLFRDMKKAVGRILLAHERKEKVVIFGDYDADGVCATAVLHSVISMLGVTLHIHLPHRELEGYGMNMKAAEEFVAKGMNLVITCDCGISNTPEIAYLQSKGIDVIVTDHHEEPKQLPPAIAILNTNVSKETYPFPHLVGTGVAFKLAQALLAEYQKKGIADVRDGKEKWLLDLVAIATIADYGELVGENRLFTKYGLIVLEKTQRKGLQALMRLANVNPPIDVTNVAFQLIPRLNAASRMEHANTACELLLTESDETAAIVAAKLDKLNRDRQKASDAMYEKCIKQIGENPEQPLLIAKGDGWGAGLLGLVAGKLLHRFHKPVIVMGINKDVCVASGRSISAFDITKALEEHAELLIKFGGHPQACGFSVLPKNTGALCDALLKAASAVSAEELEDTLDVDAEIPMEEISWELWDELKQFSPFGEANPRPVFVTRNVVVQTVRSVGSSGKHLQVMVQHDGGSIRKTIAFGFAEDWQDQLPRGTAIDIAYEISLNEWNGSRELQIKLLDIKKAA